MAEKDLLHSESDGTPESTDQEEEGQENTAGYQRQGITDYEKQRLSRIAENKKRMEAMGLRRMASSLMCSIPKASKQKGKKKALKEDEDQDYRPNDDEDVSDDDEDVDEDEDDGGFVVAGSRKKRVRSKDLKCKKKVNVQNLSTKSGCFDEDDVDDELRQAIALSLQDSMHTSSAVHSKGRKESPPSQRDPGRRRREKSFARRVQMTEDEIVMHFFQFDELGKGYMTMRDLERIAAAHDFTWTDKELADMINCFDSNRDEKLSLDDFRKIVSRCNMIQESGDS